MTQSGAHPHATSEKPAHPRCAVSGRELSWRDATRLSLVRPSLAERIRADHPDLAPDAFVGRDVLGEYRSRYVEEMLVKERGELSDVERQVVDGLKGHEIATSDIEEEIEERRTFGDRLADHVATFGGSWTFITAFGIMLATWMAFNSTVPEPGRFDPYPYILLNLVLSCLAAIQAPIIMMSQRRQEAKDRLRSENDYRVNLKAELEIRHLHEKVDHLLTRQWERLTELQQIQIEMLHELSEGTKRRRPKEG